MTGFKVLGTNHTSFVVSELDRTLAFFTGVLGFTATEKRPRGRAVLQGVTCVSDAEILVAFVDGPGHRVELIEYSGPPDRGRVEARPCDTGATHIAFNVDDIEAAIAASEGAGYRSLGAIQVTDDGPNKGSRIVYMRDADGITIEYIQPPPR